VLVAGGVDGFVGEIAEERVLVVDEDALGVDEVGAARAVEEVVEGAERKGIHRALFASLDQTVCRAVTRSLAFIERIYLFQVGERVVRFVCAVGASKALGSETEKCFALGVRLGGKQGYQEARVERQGIGFVQLNVLTVERSGEDDGFHGGENAGAAVG
jgi:hypothetical protein